MRGSLPVLLVPTLSLLAAGCAEGLPDPDGTWQITVISTDPEDFGETCLVDGVQQDFQAIEDSFQYALYQEGAAVELRIDGEVFATGAFLDGCTIEYSSPAYLDTFNGAEVQWQVSGIATIDGAAGGCVDDPELDWDGSETVYINRSDAEALPAGCTRELDVTGIRAG